MLAKSSRWFLVVCVVLAVAAPAGAKEKEKPREIVAVADSGVGVAPGAPDWVRERVTSVLEAKPTSVRSLASVRPTNWIGCRTVWAYRGYNNWLGFTLFRYYQQVSWCSNGFGIYSYGRDRWPEAHYGWRFDGHIGSSITGGYWSRSAWTQGSFAFCPASCYDHKYPWVTITVNAAGDWDANSGG